MWRSIWAAAWTRLGLRWEQFQHLTPRQFYWLLDDHDEWEIEQQRQAQWNTGVVAAVVANYSMGAPETPRLPGSFPLSLIQDMAPKLPRMTKARRQTLAASVRATFAKDLERWRKQRGKS
jgi:hypothetical protein